ncbi:MAG: type II secretion system protein GspL [Legionellaceae bacterium]|nr:type II secretion system protein GspL [Legionellaceae bacterium]
MYTCFLFAEHFDEENCLSLRLDELGQIDEPLMRRTMDELQLLQTNSQTVVVLPTQLASLFTLELPWLTDQKARAAIPYALEDQLAESVTLLHFAFDRQHYQHDRYLVVVIAKQIIMDLMSKLIRLQLNFDVITLDCFALNLGEACVIENSMLIYDVTFQGALSIGLLDNYFKNQTSYSHIFAFNDSVPLTHADQFTRVENVSYAWIAERLLKQKPMNLCQGGLQHNTNQKQTKRWYQLAALLGGVWLIGLLVMNAVLLGVLKNHVADYDAKIAVVYRQFFPETRQVISPRFRIGQLLKQNQSGQDALLWQLLEKLAYAAFPSHADAKSMPAHDTLNIQRIRFQNKTLSVTLACNDFAELEQIQARLQHDHVTVRQAGAATQANQVVATLELT